MSFLLLAALVLIMMIGLTNCRYARVIDDQRAIIGFDMFSSGKKL